VEESKFVPFVLPLNWNWRPPLQPLFFGPIKIYHMYDPVMPGLDQWNADQSKAGNIIRHAWLQQTVIKGTLPPKGVGEINKMQEL